MQNLEFEQHSVRNVPLGKKKYRTQIAFWILNKDTFLTECGVFEWQLKATERCNPKGLQLNNVKLRIIIRFCSEWKLYKIAMRHGIYLPQP